MAQFRVDPEALALAATRLDIQRSRVTEASTSATLGNLGDPRLVAQAQETEAEIVGAVEKAARGIDSMATTLRAAASTYADADAGVANAMTPRSPAEGARP